MSRSVCLALVAVVVVVAAESHRAGDSTGPTVAQQTDAILSGVGTPQQNKVSSKRTASSKACKNPEKCEVDAKIQELARKYAPLIYMNTKEKYFPASVPEFFKHVTVSKEKGKRADTRTENPKSRHWVHFKKEAEMKGIEQCVKEVDAYIEKIKQVHAKVKAGGSKIKRLFKKKKKKKDKTNEENGQSTFKKKTEQAKSALKKKRKQFSRLFQRKSKKDDKKADSLLEEDEMKSPKGGFSACVGKVVPWIHGVKPTKDVQPAMYAFVRHWKDHPEVFDIAYWAWTPWNMGKHACLGLWAPSVGISKKKKFPIGFRRRCIGKRLMMGAHMGDWEHVTVRFDSKTLEPIRGYWSSHNFGFSFTWKSVLEGKNVADPADLPEEKKKSKWEKVKAAGASAGKWVGGFHASYPKKPPALLKGTQHPVYYFAEGSHGVYPVPGLHKYGPIGGMEDDCDKGAKWETWRNLHVVRLDKEEAFSGNYLGEWDWLNYQGRFGTKKKGCRLKKLHKSLESECILNAGPTPPVMKGPMFRWHDKIEK